MYVVRSLSTTNGRSRLLGGAAVAVLVLSAAACGGGGSKTTTTTASGTPTDQWAGGVCTSITTWKKSLETIKTNVAANPSESSIKKAGQQFEAATETLATSLKGLGKPDTAQGQAAQQNIDTLATTLEGGMNKIKQTLKSSSGAAGVLSQITTITGTLSAMANNLKMAGNNLKNFAPSGELQQAFKNASACQPYVHG